MNRALAFLLCLSISLPCAAARAPSLSGDDDKEVDLHLESKAGLPEQTIHFTIEAYGTTASNKSVLLENAYNAFIDVTGLTSFDMQQKIHVLIFENRKEFRQKLHGGAKNAATGAHTLATFEQTNLDKILVTNLSNLMLETYLGRKLEKEDDWVRQGVAQAVAVFIGDENEDNVREDWRNYLKRAKPVSLEQLTGKSRVVSDKDPTSETEFEKEKTQRKGDHSSTKRLQTTADSLTLFLREWGGKFNFAFFLTQLRGKKSMDEAVALSYPGKFRDLPELYNYWLQEDVGALKTPDPSQK